MTASQSSSEKLIPIGRLDRRRLIRHSFIGSGMLGTLSLSALAMSLLLTSLGDETGAHVAVITALTTGIVWLATHIFLVNLLALSAMDSNMEGASPVNGCHSSSRRGPSSDAD